MKGTPIIDLVVLAVLLIAVGRGIWIGLIREGLSIVSIGVATIITRIFVDPVSLRLTEITSGEISGRAAIWIAGTILVVTTILVVGTLSRFLRRGARMAGLGWADRVGGGALGLAEGAVVSAILVVITLWLVGPGHPSVSGSRSLAAFDELRSLQSEGALPAVGAAGPSR